VSVSLITEADAVNLAWGRSNEKERKMHMYSSLD